MATSTADLTITRLQKDGGRLNILDRDGKPDTTTPLTVTSDLDSVASIAVDAADNRRIIITGNSPGPVAVHARCGTSQLTVNCTVQDIDASSISVEFEPPTPK